MFYERLKGLCDSRGISVTKLVEEFGHSSGNLSKWKSGRGVNASTARKFAEYFGVSVDYLLGTSNEFQPELKGVDFALEGEIRSLTPDEKDDILAYIQFKKSQRK